VCASVRTLRTRVPCVALARLRLETSYCNGVPVLCPVFSGRKPGSCSWSPACQISLSILGEMLTRQVDYSFLEYYCCMLRSAPIEPCGTPLSVRLNFQSAKYPALSNCCMRWINGPSWMCSLSAETISSWSRLLKQPEMSPPGSREAVMPPSPLRTARARFRACRSSFSFRPFHRTRFQHREFLAMNLAMTIGME
jgi:hypothetical protein